MDETSEKKNTRKTGDIGEKLAAKYLKSQGFAVLETNYLKNWGELDIVAKNMNIIHFIEVKTFSYESRQALEKSLVGDQWRPEELVDDRKLHQIEKALESWLSEHKWGGEWVIDVIAIRMVTKEKYSTLNFIHNILAE